jgi:hypothetical protein
VVIRWSSTRKNGYATRPNKKSTTRTRASCFLENEQTGALYDKIADGTASESEISQLRKHAAALGISPEGTENIVASARAASEQATTTSEAEPSGEVSSAGKESEVAQAVEPEVKALLDRMTMKRS